MGKSDVLPVLEPLVALGQMGEAAFGRQVSETSEVGPAYFTTSSTSHSRTLRSAINWSMVLA